MTVSVMNIVERFLGKEDGLTLFEVFDKVRFADDEEGTADARKIVHFLMEKYAMVNVFDDGPAVNYGIHAIYNYFVRNCGGEKGRENSPDDFRDALRQVFGIERDITERPTVLGDLTTVDCGL